jgi:UDP-3-O-[3-hydroxymyristoyl] glucosamine N-acyltransferase
VTVLRKTVAEIAEHVGGRVIGNGQLEISKVSSIEDAGPDDITFLAHPRYKSFLADSKAAAVIVGRGVAEGLPPGRIPALVEVPNPYLAFAKILQLFTAPTRFDCQISSLASIDPTATLENEVTVFPHVFIGPRVTVKRKTVLYPGVFLGDGVEVGRACILYPNVTVRERCRIGDRVILHPGVVIGSDGFGYAGEGKNRIKIPQVGIVVIEDDVEIGANTTVDRATLGQTIIRKGVKIDNLVQIAHNVSVGENSIIAAQAGIAGSTTIGKDVVLAGQVGVVNHIEIGDGAKIGPQSGVPRSVPAGALRSSGIEASPHKEWLRVMTLLPQLPKLWTSVRSLEKKISRLLKAGEKETKRHARR